MSPFSPIIPSVGPALLRFFIDLECIRCIFPPHNFRAHTAQYQVSFCLHYMSELTHYTAVYAMSEYHTILSDITECRIWIKKAFLELWLKDQDAITNHVQLRLQRATLLAKYLFKDNFFGTTCGK